MTASAPPPGGEPVPYRETTDDTYAELAAQTFTAEEPKPGVLALHGPCPRCGAIMDWSVITDIFEGMRSLGHPLRLSPPTQRDAEHVEPIMCACDDDHPRRPEGRVGCGAYWTFLVQAGPL